MPIATYDPARSCSLDRYIVIAQKAHATPADVTDDEIRELAGFDFGEQARIRQLRDQAREVRATASAPSAVAQPRRSSGISARTLEAIAQGVIRAVKALVFEPLAARLATLERRCAALDQRGPSAASSDIEARLSSLESDRIGPYRDIHVEGMAYRKGEVVTWGGGLWIARADTSEKPGAGATAWKLCVKAGRDGKACTCRGVR